MSHDRGDAANSNPCQPVPDQPPQHSQRFKHLHSGIGLHTPADVHFGLAAEIADQRHQVLAQARTAHPERFAPATARPKILDLPDAAWINKPTDPDDHAEQEPSSPTRHAA